MGRGDVPQLYLSPRCSPSRREGKHLLYHLGPQGRRGEIRKKVGKQRERKGGGDETKGGSRGKGGG